MKKIIFFIICAILSLNIVEAKDYSAMCSTVSAKKTFTGTLASLSGGNFLTRNIIEHSISKELNKEADSKFKIKIENFYGTNLINGEFKSLSAKSKKAVFDGINFSDIEAQTICDYNKVSYKDNKVIFDENLILKYNAKITQQDLDKTLESSTYKKVIDKMNADKIISSLFKIQNSKIKIKEDKLIFTYEVVPLPKLDILSISNFTKANPIRFNFGAGLRADEGKLELCDFDFNSISTKYNRFLPLINTLNPLSYGLKLQDSAKGKLDIQSIQINNENIAFSGFLVINKTEK